jgi:plastocyanin
MKNQQLGILLLLATTLTSIPLALTVPTTKGSVTRHFNIYQNNSTGGAGCSGQANCFNSSSPGLTINVNQGDTVEFTVHNNDSIAHTFTLIGSPYSVNVNTGGYHQNSSSTPFVASTAGTFKYECTIHPSDMFGNFVVKQVSSTPISPASILALLGTITAAAFITTRKRR